MISLVLGKTFKGPGPEAYYLRVSQGRVSPKARTEVGIFRGIQLIPLPDSVKGDVYGIPSCTIKDHPRFGWRGLNLDCVRHFMTKDFIKRYIDLPAYYKFSFFHWHLTDDQRVENTGEEVPKLTESGAWRTGPDGKKYGGYYTRKVIKEIAAYAKSRPIAHIKYSMTLVFVSFQSRPLPPFVIDWISRTRGLDS